METATLDDLMALNDQLAALAAAGVPVDVGLDHGNTSEALARTNATIARRVSRGASLADALEGDQPGISPAYRGMLQAAVRSGRLSTPLAASAELAETVDSSRDTVRLAFLYPLLVCVFAYAGFVWFCLYLVPKLVDIVKSFQGTPGTVLSILESLGDTVPYWVAIWPLVLIVAVAWWWIRSKRNPRHGGFGPATAWLPGTSRSVFDERCAIFAGTLATLVENGVPVEEGLPLAADACGDAQLSGAAKALADGLTAGQPPSDDSRTAMSFPPFLRWSLWHSAKSVGLGEALRVAADVYQTAARRRGGRLRLVLPAAMCVVIGGGATLLYCLALFVPVVELLRTIGQ